MDIASLTITIVVISSCIKSTFFELHYSCFATQNFVSWFKMLTTRVLFFSNLSKISSFVLFLLFLYALIVNFLFLETT